jgi:predicted HTH transcriptional regulator
MNSTEFANIVQGLLSLPAETEWVEFKHNNADPQEIGEYISALANSAALHNKVLGYIVWGIEDGTHNLVGTNFKPLDKNIGGQALENWLATQLEPRIDFKIFENIIDGKPIVLFQIQPASYIPVRFRGVEYIRIGSYKKRLNDHPEKERTLWSLFNKSTFESVIALSGVSSDEVLDLLDYTSYFRLTTQPLPDNREAILSKLNADLLIIDRGNGKFDITNLGAILFASRLNAFDRLARKALRVIVYKGTNRVETLKEQPGGKGYAVGFQGAVSWISDQLPQNEQIKQSLRQEVRVFPEIAIREIVANALIHQDFNISGAGPMVEIFDDRIEISNPGTPLIDPLRFIDEPPRSRNEKLAALMRRMRICEERGSGIDKVVFAIEAFQLPAPDFRVAGGSTVAVLFVARDFSQMDRSERIRACYQHSCLLYVSGKRMTNASLRQRLGIKDTNYPIASKIISDTIDAKLIKSYGEGTGSKRDSSYLPFWA